MEKNLRLSVIDLGFGDSGKGQFVAAFAQQLGAGASLAVLRFNGGAQAGHNVTLPDGRHHTFSQFGAASFLPHAQTLLASPVVIHPGALLFEAKLLEEAAVQAPLERISIDARCLVITPYTQTASALREAQAKHGSCGVGVGETRRLALAHPQMSLNYADLHAIALDKLEAQRLHYATEFPQEALFADTRLSRLWLMQCAALISRVPACSVDELATRANAALVIFEGAQGVLLDEWHGFHPHTTWSSTTPRAAQAVADELALGRLRHFGVLRSYLTRHGVGPFPTETAALDALEEPHNADLGPQGKFRRGMPDAALLRYALSCAPEIEALLCSHLDAPARVDGGLRWCVGYAHGPNLEPNFTYDLAHQAALARALFTAQPRYDATAIQDPQSAVSALAAFGARPVVGESRGPTLSDVNSLKAAVT